MTSRILGAVGAAVVVGTLVGCGTGPAPEPVPTPTAAFASEEEAFAAAEEVYRAYNEALNARQSDQAAGDPQRFLTSAALETYIDGENTLDSFGLRIAGDASVTSFTGRSAELSSDSARLTALVCIDVSEVTVFDAANIDVTPVERGDMIAQSLTFVGTSQSLLISDESPAETTTC